jgi:hypothetical protein
VAADHDPSSSGRFADRLLNQRLHLFLRRLFGTGGGRKAAEAAAAGFCECVQYASNQRSSLLGVGDNRRIEATTSRGPRNDFRVNIEKTEAVRDRLADLFHARPVGARYANNTTHHCRRYDRSRTTSSGSVFPAQTRAGSASISQNPRAARPATVAAQRKVGNEDDPSAGALIDNVLGT